MAEFLVGSTAVGPDSPTYFIADIAANHDGDLGRAVDLIHAAAVAGADAAKFQNFTAEKIVSDFGFRALGGRSSHQAAWSKSVVEVYRDASIPLEWTPTLKAACDGAGIAYFSAPYDLEAVDYLDEYMPAYKVGSGDITWLESVERMASKGKPLLLATGASTLEDVQAAMSTILRLNDEVCLMQCNTNYTNSDSNFDHINLRVLRQYADLYPDVVLGLSDHTPGHSTVLGAVALGARVVEKHFTDDVSREGPDHAFSLDGGTWRTMVDNTRQLERALGVAEKSIAPNEVETVVLQRRAVRADQDLSAGTVLCREDVVVLRPAPADELSAADLTEVVGRTLTRDLAAGEGLRRSDLG